MSGTNSESGASAAARRNIEEVVRLEQEADQRRSLADRVANTVASFAGTVAFVVLHLALFAAWATVNSGAVPGIPPFDRYPFSLLCMIVSMEGVLLSTFVLIKQNRMGARADERSHLSLQISLLTEQEVTKVIKMLDSLSARLADDQHVHDPEARELAQHTAVDSLAAHLREQLGSGG